MTLANSENPWPEEMAILTYPEAAHYLRISEATLRHKVQYREVPFFRLGRSVRFRRKELDAFIDQLMEES